MRIAMMLYAGFQLLEVTGPIDMFHEANRLYGGTLKSSISSGVAWARGVFERHGGGYDGVPVGMRAP
jgi:hypothetical protein